MKESLTAILMFAGLCTLAGLHEGCGLITAPVSVPGAVAENANFNFSFQPVDQDGKPLNEVLLSQQLDHHFWTPIMGGTDTDERVTRRADGRIEVHERGRDLNLVFSRDGYSDASFSVTADHPDLLVTNLGTWQAVPNFPVVMISKKIPNADVHVFNQMIDYSDYPKQAAIELARLADPANRAWVATSASAENAASLAPGTLYTTMTKVPPPALNARGDIDLVDVNLPDNFALHIAGAGNGFVRIAPRAGYPPIRTADAAPAGGYVPEFAISRARLKAMRIADPTRVIDNAEYFFIKAQGHYGKGMITWDRSMSGKPSSPNPTTFRIAVWMQVREGDTNLTTHDSTPR